MDRKPVHGTTLSPLLAFAIGGVLVDGALAPRLSWRRTGEGYQQACSVAGAAVAVDDGVALRFELPAADVDFLLLEPAAIPGRYHLGHLALAGAPVADLRRRLIAARGRIAPEGGPGRVTVTADAHRPAVEIDVRGLGAGAEAFALELVLRRETDASMAAGGLDEVLDVLSREGRARDEALAGLDRRLVSLSTPLAAIEEALGSADAGGGLDERLAALARGQSEAAAALMARVDQLDHAMARAAAAVEDGREAAARASEASSQALAALQERVERVVHSVENVFWRRWLRALRGGGR